MSAYTELNIKEGMPLTCEAMEYLKSSIELLLIILNIYMFYFNFSVISNMYTQKSGTALLLFR